MAEDTGKRQRKNPAAKFATGLLCWRGELGLALPVYIDMGVGRWSRLPHGPFLSLLFIIPYHIASFLNELYLNCK